MSEFENEVLCASSFVGHGRHLIYASLKDADCVGRHNACNKSAHNGGSAVKPFIKGWTIGGEIHRTRASLR